MMGGGGEQRGLQLMCKICMQWRLIIVLSPCDCVHTHTQKYRDTGGA